VKIFYNSFIPKKSADLAIFG